MELFFSSERQEGKVSGDASPSNDSRSIDNRLSTGGRSFQFRARIKTKSDSPVQIECDQRCGDEPDDRFAEGVLQIHRRVAGAALCGALKAQGRFFNRKRVLAVKVWLSNAWTTSRNSLHVTETVRLLVWRIARDLRLDPSIKTLSRSERIKHNWMIFRLSRFGGG